MAVEDTWTLKDGRTPSKRYGRGLRWRVRKRGVPARSFRTKAEADRYWIRVLSEPVRPKVAQVAVDELSERLLATKARLAPKTREMYANGSRHVLNEFSGRLAGDLLPSEIRVWIGGLTKRGGEPASNSLRQQALSALSLMLELAVEDGVIPRNPCAKIAVDRGGRREGRHLTAGELQHLARCAGDAELMILLMGTTGIRVGEAASLRVGSFDLARLRGRVERQAGAGREGPTKTRKGRDVPLAPPVAERIKEAVKGRRKTEYLFLSPQGHRISVRNWRSRVFYPAVERAKLAGLVPHDLRHTAASLAIASGADIKAVQEMMGHATATMTWDLYGHLYKGALDDVARRMGAMLEASSGYESGTPEVERDGGVERE